MKRYHVLILLSASLLAGTAMQAQSQSAVQGEGYDFDTLAACSVVYGRIGGLYAERGNDSESRSFASTATAYSASAFHMLRNSFTDQGAAYTYSVSRMDRIVEELNNNARNHPEGETGVIEEWLAYCDTLGQGVTRILTAREQGGGW